MVKSLIVVSIVKSLKIRHLIVLCLVKLISLFSWPFWFAFISVFPISLAHLYLFWVWVSMMLISTVDNAAFVALPNFFDVLEFFIWLFWSKLRFRLHRFLCHKNWFLNNLRCLSLTICKAICINLLHLHSHVCERLVYIVRNRCISKHLLWNSQVLRNSQYYSIIALLNFSF